MHEDFKTASETKIHHSIELCVMEAQNLLEKSAFFSLQIHGSKYIPVTAMLLFTLYIDLEYYNPCHIKYIYYRTTSKLKSKASKLEYVRVLYIILHCFTHRFHCHRVFMSN